MGPTHPNQRWPFRAWGFVPSASPPPWALRLGFTGLSPQKPGTPWATRVSGPTYPSTPPPPHFLLRRCRPKLVCQGALQGLRGIQQKGETPSLSEPPTSLQPSPAACGVRGPKASLGSWWPWPSFCYLTPRPAFRSWAGFPIPRESSPFPPSLAGPPCGKNDFYFSVWGACALAVHTVSLAGVPGWGRWQWRSAFHTRLLPPTPNLGVGTIDAP